MVKAQILSRTLIIEELTPVLNTPDFTYTFSHMPLDNEGLMRELEFIAPIGTSFKLIERISPFIAQVSFPKYPSEKPLFIDTRFNSQTAFDITKKLPSHSKILEALKKSVGLPYLWGGNAKHGIPKIRKLYPSSKNLEEPLLTLKGLDCSGLLYEAAEGLTPRNTSDLIGFGVKVHSFSNLQPLDLLVWPGHVILVLDKKRSIESLAGNGVVINIAKNKAYSAERKKAPN